MRWKACLVFASVLVAAGATACGPSTGAPSAGGTWTRPADGAVMVFVPAGEFQMGSDADDPGAADDEMPRHAVNLDGFWIDRTEVTNAQYRKCVEAGDCEEPLCWHEDRYSALDQPVVCVDWDAAQAYATWAGGRLPTEAEWEKAARGTDGRIYPWGDGAPDCKIANFGPCTDRPFIVGFHADGASPYGVQDLAGNVWEWVADWYAEDYYSRSPESNPQGPDAGSSRVLRGGCFGSAEEGVRCAARSAYPPNLWDPYTGFRVALSSDDL